MRILPYSDLRCAANGQMVLAFSFSHSCDTRINIRCLKKTMYCLEGDNFAHSKDIEEVRESYESLRKWKFSDI